MKQHERPVLFMTHSPFLFWRMVATNIHQGKRVISVLDSAMEMLQTEPGNSAMVELYKFAVRLKALIFIHHEVLIAFFNIKHAIQER